jgi:hypothetical protein
MVIKGAFHKIVVSFIYKLKGRSIDFSGTAQTMALEEFCTVSFLQSQLNAHQKSKMDDLHTLHMLFLKQGLFQVIETISFSNLKRHFLTLKLEPNRLESSSSVYSEIMNKKEAIQPRTHTKYIRSSKDQKRMSKPLHLKIAQEPCNMVSRIFLRQMIPLKDWCNL